MRDVVWLASYPKSGNTWLRFQLAQYYSGHVDQHIALNDLRFGRLNALRFVLDEWLALESSDLEPDDVDNCRADANLKIAADARTRVFFKVHDAYISTATGRPVFESDSTHAIIYLARHPFDVAISLAHHFDFSIDRAVTFLCNPDSRIGDASGGITAQVQQTLLSWSQHVNSWLEAPGPPPLLLRYEDMLRDPGGQLSRVIARLDGHAEQSRILAAVAATRFDRLQRAEQMLGFRERRSTRSPFFRAGQAGQWTTALSSRHMDTLVEAHRATMKRLGYLDVDDQPTTSRFEN